MKVLYIINGLGFSQNTGIGGSDKRAIEIIRNAKAIDHKSSFDILTTNSGHELFIKNEKLKTGYYVIKQPSWWPTVLKNLLLGRVLSYLYAFAISLTWYKKLRNYDIFFASSDFFFDVIPGYFYKKMHKKKLVCMIHHHIKNPFSRGGSLINNTFMFLSQRLSFILIKNMADAVFLYDTQEGKKLKKMVFSNSQKKNYLHFVKNGINEKAIDLVQNQEKKYEACFLGGLRFSKGILEFIPMWKKVIERFPKAKYIIIGGGSTENVKNLKKEVRDSGLNKNIIFTGPLTGASLFKHVKQSKIFLFPSHEEGWGIALCEAMYCELPVVCYKLPAFKIFGKDLDTYPIGNYELLAKRVIELLENPSEIKTKGKKLKEVAKKFTWSSIAQEDYDIFKKILK